MRARAHFRYVFALDKRSDKVVTTNTPAVIYSGFLFRRLVAFRKR